MVPLAEMTSPYLRRRTRRLEEAVTDTGRAPEDYGINARRPGVTSLMRRVIRSSEMRHRLGQGLVIACAFFGLILLGSAYVLDRADEVPVADIQEQTLDVVPASGPEDR